MEVIEKVKLFVIDFFEKHPERKLVFHTLEHTLYVVRRAEMIGRAEKLPAAELNTLLCAAWFHDTGYLVRLDRHEAAGAELARSFFAANPGSGINSELVIRCIEVTCRTIEPKLPIEKIILDADISHVAEDNFIDISKKLKKEKSNCLNCEITPRDYWGETLAFLEGLKFYTAYAQTNFLPGLTANIKKVKELIDKEVEKGKIKTEKKKQSTEKGIESMFRLTASNQMRLSAIADKKANILISINSILISVSAAAVSRQFISLQELFPAVFILFLSSLASLVFAILSCRPEVSSPVVSDEDLKARKTNLLFFGNFVRLPFQKYETAVREMMEDYDYLYGNLIKDQYNLGKSLQRKFKLLRMAYNIFMYGFLLTALVFAVKYFLVS